MLGQRIDNEHRAETLNLESSLNIMIHTETTRACGIETGLRTDFNSDVSDRKSAILGEEKNQIRF